MLRKYVMFLVALALLATPGFAQMDKESDEGMWLPFKVEQNIEAMKAKGFELEADNLYNEDGEGLSDAVVRLGRGFCTGEMISPQGLMLTNHHCGRNFVADLSTEEDNILENGFWAESFAEEKPCPGFTVSYLVRSEDVTAKVNGAGANSEQVINEIEEEASENGKYDATVRAMYAGSEHYLFVYKTYKDVRLVGVPPVSVGEFGGDTDNWMWPRHTGDFTMFRVYAGSDNEPADYSTDNVPYKPKNFFPISLKGIDENDYAMVMGYPGRTSRYLTSSDIELALRQNNPDIVKLRTARLDVMREAMDNDPGARLKLFKSFKGISNYWKYFIGQTKSLKFYDVAAIKAQEEAAFMEWVNANEARREKYGDVLSTIKTLNDNITEVARFNTYFQEAALAPQAASEGGLALFRLNRMMEGAGDDMSGVKERAAKMAEGLDEQFADFYYDVDKEIFARMLVAFYEDVDPEFRPAVYDEILSHKKAKKGKTIEEKFRRWVDWAYEKSVTTNKERMAEFLADPDQKTISKDPIAQFAMGVVDTYLKKGMMPAGAYDSQLSQQRKLYIEGLREMNPDKQFYPDANSTMRFTFGKIASYYPRDGVWYNYLTTIEGVMEKEDPENFEFNVPEKLKQLYKSKDYGQYATEDGELPVCFLSTTDITGGNSGSPILNGNGELIGCAFDGNWEAMASDIYVFPEVTRTISVDIRYVLFIVDKLGGATRLIEEMDIRK